MRDEDKRNDKRAEEWKRKRVVKRGKHGMEERGVRTCLAASVMAVLVASLEDLISHHWRGNKVIGNTSIDYS